MPDINKGAYVRRYAFWNPATWSIPSLYWDVFSDEQRWHAICKELGKVIKYADYLGINVDDIAGRLKAIEDGQLDDLIKTKIEEWFNENEPEIIAALEQIRADIDNLADELTDITDYDTHYLKKCGTLDYHDKTHYLVQGACFVGDDYLVIAFTNAAQDEIELRKINYKTGVDVLSSVSSQLGHAQDMTYNQDDNLIYVILYDSPGFVIVDADTLQPVQTIITSSKYLNIAYDSSTRKIYANQLGNYAVLDVFDANSNALINTYTINDTYVATITKLSSSFNANGISFMTNDSIICYNLEENKMSEIHKVYRTLDSGSITKMEFFAYVNDTDYVIGYMCMGAANTGAGVNSVTGIALHREKYNYVARVNGSGDSLRLCTAYVNTDNTAYYADGTLSNPFKSVAEALNNAVHNNFSTYRIIVQKNDYDEAFYAEGLATGCVIVSGVDLNFTGIGIRDNSVVKFISNIHVTKRAMPTWFANALGECYFGLDNNSELYISGVSYEDDAPASIYVDYDCVLQIGSLCPLIIGEIFNRGIIRSKVIRFIDPDTDTFANNANMTLGQIHNISYAPSGAPFDAASVVIPIPSTGGIIVGTLASGDHFTIPVFAGNITNLITQVDTHSIDVSISDLSQRGADATVHCATSNITYARFVNFN